MIRFFTILFSFLVISSLFAQENPGIHYLDKLKYGVDKNSVSESPYKDVPIIPLQRKESKEVSRKVFGYFPDWEYVNGSQKYFRYDLLTHIACFDFPASSSGNISNPAQWPWTDVINEAHSNGVKIIISITNFDKDDIRKIITDSNSKRNFINNALGKLNAYNVDGINIDFEGLYTSDRGSKIVDFMKELSDSVHSNFPDAEVSFASPAVNWGGHWNFLNLANACDYLFIMGYDYFGSWSDNSGPSSPLTGGSINITNTINSQYQSVVAFNPDKLILGIPYFGVYFKTESSSPGSKVKDFVNSPRFRVAQSQSQVYGKLWNTTYQVPWYRWYDGEWNQVWYDDDSSLGLKYDLAESKNLLGVGMWALGYDGERQELWNLLDYKFGSGIIPPPDKPFNFRVLADTDSTLRIKFDIPSRATRFLIMLSLDGKTFDDTVEVVSNDVIVEGLNNNTVYYFKLAAKNASGLSDVTEVLGGIPADSSKNEILVVNGFERISNTNNTFDFIRFYGEPIRHAGYSFASATNDAVFKGKVSLSDYKTVIWILADESTADETFNKFEQDSVKSFLNNGGNLFVSGAEIGWDLGRSSYSSPDDLDFYANYLKARYVSDAPDGSSSSYYTAVPVSGGIFDGLGSINYDNGTHGTIDVDWPDAIRGINGATEELLFEGVNAAKGVAGIAYHGKFPEGKSNGSLLYFTFPFETVYPESKRIDLMAKILNWFDTVVDVNESGNYPAEFVLYQNYPNPFNPNTIIKFYTPYSGTGELNIYNSLGQIVWKQSFASLASGYHSVEWNGTNNNGVKVSSGMYVYRVIINTNDGDKFIQSKKMMLLK